MEKNDKKSQSEKVEKKNEDNENKKPFFKSKLFYLVLFLVFGILIYFNFFYYSNQYQIDKNTFDYNGYIFNKNKLDEATVWQLSTEKIDFDFRNPPWDVDHIPRSDDLLYSLNGINHVFLTTQPDYPSDVVLGMVDVAKLFNPRLELYNITAQSGLMQDGHEQPKITCEEQYEGELIIEFLLANDTYIKHSNNCIQVYGETKEDVVKASNLLAYIYLGII
ncbi:MAG: hypothetical protein ACOCP8_00455 [archaeon]